MVKRVTRKFNVPLSKHDWVQKYCCDVHNILACRYLNWESPLTVDSGNTQDISKFRFHMWEPVWYFVPGVKAPKNNLLPARWLGFANSSGDDMTYYIWTENDPRRTKKGTKQARHRVLIRSVIRTRRKKLARMMSTQMMIQPTLIFSFLQMKYP